MQIFARCDYNPERLKMHPLNNMTKTPETDTLKILENAIKNSSSKITKLKKQDNQFAIFRLLSTITFLALIVGAFNNQEPIINFILILTFLLYCLLTAWIHSLIQDKQRKWKSIETSMQLQQARIQRNYEFLENHKAPWHNDLIEIPKNHLYAHDLDIHNQLFLLLDTCSTFQGSKKLLKLLIDGGTTLPNAADTKKRSQIASEISKHSQFLKRFEILKLDDLFLQKFFQNKQEEIETNNKDIHEEKNPLKEKFATIFQLLYCFICIVAWFIILFPAIILFIKTQNTENLLQPLFFYAFFILFGIGIFNPTTKKAIKISQDTRLIETVILSLKRKRKTNFEQYFSFLEKNASLKLKKINSLINILNLRGNPIFWITLHIFLPLDSILCVILIYQLKKIEPHLSKWQNELYELDLLCSFARLKLENKLCHFLTPEEIQLATTNKIVFKNIGHPLIPEHKRILNDISLDLKTPVVLLTGSNMSGKSTFLRTLGINFLLSNIGAPVFASQFIAKPAKLLCAIRVDDSIADGTSYFYAEVKRLKQILEILENKQNSNSIFFIDEIFRGTNNKERYIGSFNIIKNLFEKNTFGFVTTHDLALTDIENTDSRLRNMHFREFINEQKLEFDYKIKEGPCPTTNALFIMKQEGLPIP